jgi:hypothetical protein
MGMAIALRSGCRNDLRSVCRVLMCRSVTFESSVQVVVSD